VLGDPENNSIDKAFISTMRELKEVETLNGKFVELRQKLIKRTDEFLDEYGYVYSVGPKSEALLSME
jgi:hypothetical protein